jgi:hypothetical protein
MTEPTIQNQLGDVRREQVVRQERDFPTSDADQRIGQASSMNMPLTAVVLIMEFTRVGHDFGACTVFHV